MLTQHTIILTCYLLPPVEVTILIEFTIFMHRDVLKVVDKFIPMYSFAHRWVCFVGNASVCILIRCKKNMGETTLKQTMKRSVTELGLHNCDYHRVTGYLALRHIGDAVDGVTCLMVTVQTFTPRNFLCSSPPHSESAQSLTMDKAIADDLPSAEYKREPVNPQLTLDPRASEVGHRHFGHSCA